MNERFRINDWSCGWLLEQNVATDWFGKMASTWAESETSHILHPKEGERQHRRIKCVPWLEYNKTYLKIDNETNNFWNGAEEGSYLK